VFGELPPVDVERLGHLAEELGHVSHSAHYVDYHRAEELCEVLADRLIARYGTNEVRGFVFRAVPRGGHIVLGMLSYALGLSPDSLDRTGESEAPVVLVDDCALSGVRLNEHLTTLRDRPAIVALLCAPAGFGAAAIDRFSNLDACVTAFELADLGPPLLGDRYDEWRAAQNARLGRDAIWIGRPEYVCFDWNEPDSSFFNSVTGELERGFRLVHPVLEEVAESSDDSPVEGPADGESRRTDAVLVHRDGPGPYNAAPSVVSARLDTNRIAVADLSDTSSERTAVCYLLEGTAADIWSWLLARGTLEAAATAVAEEYDVEPGVVLADVAQLADELLEKGLLVRE
jgi:hypothetical protein